MERLTNEENCVNEKCNLLLVFAMFLAIIIPMIIIVFGPIALLVIILMLFCGLFVWIICVNCVKKHRGMSKFL